MEKIIEKDTSKNTENKKLLCTKSDVLVVDGNEERRKDICNLLYGYGTATDEAGDMQLAVKLAAEHVFDLVFIVEGENDIIGLELVSKILPQIGPYRPKPKFAVFMESFEKELELEYMRNGIAAVVPLPLDEDMLGMLLENIVPEEKRLYIDKATSESRFDVRMAELFMSNVDVVTAARKNDTIEDYLDLLDLFYTDGLKRVDSLKDKIVSQDFRNYVIEVHGLKSSAANIGANAVSELAKQHEAAGNESDFTYIEENKVTLFDSYEKLLLEIERVLKKAQYGQFAPKDASADAGKETASDDVILEHLNGALSSLEMFNSKEAAQKIDELLSFALPDNIKEGVEKIQVMLKMYEDDDAEDKLRELIEKF